MLFRSREWTTRLREDPVFASSVGVHEFDDRLEHGEAVLGIGEVGLVLVGGAAARYEDQRFEFKRLQDILGQDQMSMMKGIEAPAEDTDFEVQTHLTNPHYTPNRPGFNPA